MLDELMGRNRNIAPDDKKRHMHWSDDPEVCRLYIVDFCPHELFTNTKADLGPCGKVHDDAMRKMFEEEKEDSYRWVNTRSMIYTVKVNCYVVIFVKSHSVQIV